MSQAKYLIRDRPAQTSALLGGHILSPTTQNESKTLRVLIVEESHKADHKKRSDELDPMLASTAGPTWHFGADCPPCPTAQGSDAKEKLGAASSFRGSCPSAG